MAFYSVPTENALQDSLGATLAAAGVTATTSTDISAKLTDTSAATPTIMVIDRVDSNGTATPTKREYISFTGVSGTTLSGLVRGLGGSSDQEHAAGAIIEFVPDVVWAKGLYDSVVTQTGTQTLTNKTLTAPVLTSPVLNTGLSGTAFLDEDDMASNSATKVASQQSIKAYVAANLGGNVKAGTTTRDVSTASGTQAITGVGFTPKAVIFMVASTSKGNTYSFGFDDLTNVAACMTTDGTDNALLIQGSYSITLNQGAGAYYGKISAFGADGFTISWTKVSSPTGTYTVEYLAIG